MNVVILAGGYGTRLSEESAVKRKPMAEIGGHRRHGLAAVRAPP